MAKRRENLRDLFDRLGVRASFVAEQVGRSRAAVYLWLSGKSVPKPWTRIELAKALRVSDAVVKAALEETARRPE